MPLSRGELKQKSPSAKASPPPPPTPVSYAAPLGASVQRGGVDFSLFSRKASSVDLLLFDHEDDPRPAQIIPINPDTNLSYHYWHVFVPNIQPGQIYGYRVDGPVDPANGLLFDPCKVLLDPYGYGVVVPKNYNRDTASQPGDNIPTAMKSVVVDPTAYDWEGDTPLNRPATHTIVYEMHVRGFTRHPSSGVAPEIRGTYRGLIEKDPLSPATRRNRSRAITRLPVRRPGLPARPRQLLGISTPLLLLPPPRLQLSSGPSRPH